VPVVSRVFEEAEDLKDRAERDKTISETTGYRPTLATIKETYGGEWEQKPEPVSSAPAPLRRRHLRSMTRTITRPPR
jgi:hypothetical protein